MAAQSANLVCAGYGIGATTFNQCVTYQESRNPGQSVPPYRMDQYNNRVDAEGYRVDSTGRRMPRPEPILLASGHGVTYRLWGVDAPESVQPCADGWPAGRAATEHLRALIGERHVTCEPRTLDRYGRTVAVCHVDGRDLGADMVADGHAWAFVRYSRDYVEEER